MSLKIQAREIVRYARRNNLTIKRGSVGHDGEGFCARAVVYHAFLGEKGTWDNKNWNLYNTYPQIPVSETNLNLLESGFEGTKDYATPENVKNTYYKMGRKVAELAGL